MAHTRENWPTVTLKSRPQSPHSFFRLKFCDNSSGYSSATSLASSGFHSLKRAPSLQCVVHPQTQSTNRTITIERPTRTQLVKDSITNILDQIDKRVSFLRETAAELEEEKRKLYDVLNSIITCEDLSAIAEGECIYSCIE